VKNLKTDDCPAVCGLIGHRGIGADAGENGCAAEEACPAGTRQRRARLRRSSFRPRCFSSALARQTWPLKLQRPIPFERCNGCASRHDRRASHDSPGRGFRPVASDRHEGRQPSHAARHGPNRSASHPRSGWRSLPSRGRAFRADGHREHITERRIASAACAAQKPTTPRTVDDSRG